MCSSIKLGDETVVFLHESKKENMESILKNGLLMSSHVKHIDGQGPRNKILTSNLNHFLAFCEGDVDQVDGVYFTVMTQNDFPKCFMWNGKSDEFVYFSLDSEWLKEETVFWYFNSAENHGFYLNNLSHFSGNEGSTLFSIEEMLFWLNQQKFENIDNELVVLNNVPPRAIQIFPSAELEEIFKTFTPPPEESEPKSPKSPKRPKRQFEHMEEKENISQYLFRKNRHNRTFSFVTESPTGTNDFSINLMMISLTFFYLFLLTLIIHLNHSSQSFFCLNVM